MPLGVGSGVHGVGYAVAGGDFGYVLAYGGYYAGGFASGRPGEGVGGVGAFAAGDVGVVDADGLDFYQGLAGAGRRLRGVLVAQGFGAAGLVDAHGFHCGPPCGAIWGRGGLHCIGGCD